MSDTPDERVDDHVRALTSPRSRFQISLIDLISAVLGLGIAFGLASRLEPTSGKNEYVLLALVLVPFVIWLSIRLIEQVLRLVRAEIERAGGNVSAARQWCRGSVVWRVNA